MAQRVTPAIPSAAQAQSAVNGLPAIVQHWMLRILIDLKGEQYLIGRHGFKDEDVATQLGFRELLTEAQFDDPDIGAVRKHLRSMAKALKQEAIAVPDVLAANVSRIADLVGLSTVETRLFEFVVLMKSYPVLKDLCEKPNNLRARQLTDRLAALLELPGQAVWEALRPQATLVRSGLLSISQRSYPGSVESQLELINDSLPDQLTESPVEPKDWLRGMVRPGEASQLQWSDYAHIDKQLDVLRPYLRQALATGQRGVNVFIYGPPGTGKTQLARLLAQDMGCELFEVTTEDEDKEAIGGRKRVKAHCAANSFFARHSAMILFDEVEEVFTDNDSANSFLKLLRPDAQTGHTRKAWINQILESNPLPTVWVANSLHGLDPAFARRFDIVLELPVPPRTHRERIIREAGGELLTAQAVARLAESEQLAPAVVAKAVDVVKAVSSKLQATSSDAVHMLVNNTLQAQRHRPVRAHNPDALPELYDPAYINADINLNEVAQLLQIHQTGRLCLYGLPGTGKTAFGRWLAQQLGVPLHVRRASDLLGMYVGESEKNIARAFAEAQADGGVLMIDEVDSFLQDRQNAERSWEVSQVNEMLTQMESFAGVFIASTNLMDKLDPAVLRRFDLKVRFNPLQPEQAKALLGRYCEQLNLPVPDAPELARLQNLTQLTPGDFAAVQRQSRLRPLRNAGDWVTALQAECAIKPKAKTSGIGFV